jgi:hypothetical protein
MATAFDGIGMGMLGSEKKYMSSDRGGKPSPLAFLAGSLLKPKEKTVELPPFSIGTLPSEQSPNAVAPPSEASPEPIAPIESSGSNEVAPDNAQLSEEHPDTQRALEDMGFTSPIETQKPITSVSLSAVTPDFFKTRNPAQDQLAAQYAVAPPTPMNLPQYGNQGGNGGGLSSLLSLFA